jgi:hypothetical protein
VSGGQKTPPLCHDCMAATLVFICFSCSKMICQPFIGGYKGLSLCQDLIEVIFFNLWFKSLYAIMKFGSFPIQMKWRGSSSAIADLTQKFINLGLRFSRVYL